ncbi:unnamed protein product [Moneuplotes crassus]|uniref:Clathrin/coatomer adaptor adaptin-like N-terminal domain-containing protein n=1 Tax=Euplotes crassus TaxID=5936 RepID=A0AAD2D9N7_EUPCR|nr:unnamed protein product [Moneuplotes crassus]
MEIISTTFKRIKSGGQAAVPRIGSVTKKGISVVGNLGSKIIKGKQKPKNAQSIMSLLTEGDIKYGDENLLEDEEAIFECLLNTNPKEVCKALTTILSILLYCSNSSHSSRSAPNLDSALTEEEDLRTRIMKKFYPAVVNCIQNENKEVKKLAMLVILQTFKEDNETTIMCINSLLKEVINKDAERRVNGIRLMSSIANNDIYPFIYAQVQKGMNDLNPLVRRVSYAGLYKLKNICDMGNTETFVPDDESENDDDENETETEDLCLRLLRNTLHNTSEEEKEVGIQTLKPEENENVLAIALYLLDKIIDEENGVEQKISTIHPVFYTIIEKLDEIDEIIISQITPILIRYSKRYMATQIKESRFLNEGDMLPKQVRKVTENLLNALHGLSNPAAVLSLCQFFLVVAPAYMMDQVATHLIRIFKELEIGGETDDELTAYTVLHFIEAILKNNLLLRANPKIFKNFSSLRFINSLFVKTDQSQYYCVKKLIILDLICDRIKDNSTVRKIILDEHFYQTKNASYIIAMQALEGMKNCGLERNGINENSKSMFYPSIRYMIKIVKNNKDDRVLGRCVQNLHVMLLKDKKKTAEVVYYLVSLLDRISSPPAKARIVKLIIDFIDYFKTLARETFRKLVKNFTNEKLPVKFQIIQLGVTLMLIKFDDAEEKLEAIFKYVLQLGMLDADYGLNQFTRMIKGVFDKGTLFGGAITTKTAFTRIQNPKEDSKNVEEYKNVDIPHEERKVDLLQDFDKYYFLSLSNILNLPQDQGMSLEIDQCNEEQQVIAEEHLQRTGAVKEKHESVTKGKVGESIGFAVTNSKGKSVQSIGSDDVKIIQGITKKSDKSKQSYAFKDKTQLKKELEDWFDDDDEDEKIS